MQRRGGERLTQLCKAKGTLEERIDAVLKKKVSRSAAPGDGGVARGHPRLTCG